MKKLLALILTAVLSVSSLAACGETEDTSSTDANVTTYRVVFVEGDIPKGFTDENGKITGYDVEVFEAINELWTDIELEFEIIDQTGVFLGVETGRYQIASSGFFKNPSREEKFLFPLENLGYSPLNLLVQEDSTYNSLEDMQGKVFVPLPANWGNHYILSQYIAAHPEGNYTFETIDNIALADIARWIDEGRYDAYFGPTEWVDSIKEELGLNVKVSDVVHYEPTYPLFNIDNEELVARYDEAIEILKSDGKLSELSEKWFGTDIFADKEALDNKQ